MREIDLSQGPPPCQDPDCDRDAILASGYVYCVGHASLAGDRDE